jgi:hypothetical protein
MRALLLILLAFLVHSPAAAQNRFAHAVEIGQVDSLWSERLGENRPYLVWTPPSYADSLAGDQRYPVLFVLDGDAHFHSVSGLVQALGTGVNATYVVPEMIVVAIPNTNRARDLSPTHVATGVDGAPRPDLEASGGGPAFLGFIRTELIPHIESRYRTLPWRVLVGHSLGGITALSALYTMPETFNAYVAIDPSLWWDDRVLLRQARDYFSTADLDGRSLWVAQANTINPADTTRNLHFESITRFNAVMNAYDRSGLRYGFRYYDGDSHGSVPLIAEYDALRFIFEGYTVPIQRALAEPAALMRHYREVSSRFGVSFQPPRRVLIQLEAFAITRDTANAIEFLTTETELYPRGTRAWELLGDIHVARGEVAKARGFYEQALAIAPDNERIRGKVSGVGR